MDNDSTIQLLVNIDVPDLDRAIRFYSVGLGMHVGRRLGATGVEMVGGSANVYLLAKSEGSTAFVRDDAPLRTYRRHWTPVHLDIVCNDIEAAVERACGAGAQLEQAVSAHAWGSIAVLSDPFGHGFCLIQFTPQGYDAISDEPAEPAVPSDKGGQPR